MADEVVNKQIEAVEAKIAKVEDEIDEVKGQLKLVAQLEDPVLREVRRAELVDEKKQLRVKEHDLRAEKLLLMAKVQPPGRYILAPDAQLRAARSLFVILSTEHEPVGVGFFVERNGLAVTANHVLADTDVPRSNSNSPSPPCLVDVLFYDASGQHTLSGHMEVVLRNSYLDVAVLATTQKDDERDFLDLDVSHDSIMGREVVLCAFQIGLDSTMLADFGRRLALAKGSIQRIGHEGRHFVYDSNTYVGDSGGAVVFENGKVIGLHQVGYFVLFSNAALRN
jgi:S1-C subfamily serine protease